MKIRQRRTITIIYYIYIIVLLTHIRAASLKNDLSLNVIVIPLLSFVSKKN